MRELKLMTLDEWRARAEKAEAEQKRLREDYDLMREQSSCIHCEQVFKNDDTDPDHWRTCPNHPARIELDAALARAEKAEAALQDQSDE